jgi:hypothetical protein
MRKCAAKCPDKQHTGDWFYHHNNVSAHSSLSVQQFLSALTISPELASKLKLELTKKISELQTILAEFKPHDFHR